MGHSTQAPCLQQPGRKLDVGLLVTEENRGFRVDYTQTIFDALPLR